MEFRQKTDDIENAGDYNIALLSPCGYGNMGDAAIQESAICGLKDRLPTANFFGITLQPADTAIRHRIPAFPMRRTAGSPEEVLAQSYSGPNNQTSEPVPAAGQVSATASNKSFLSRIKRTLIRIFPFGETIYGEFRHTVAAYQYLKKMDVLIVSGGGQLDDYWGGAWGQPFSLFKWSHIARLRGKPVYFLSVGAGPIDSRLSRWFIRRALYAADYRSYRDNASAMLVSTFAPLASGDEVPDLAHALPLESGPKNIDLQKLIIAIGPIPYFAPDSWPKKGAAEYLKYVGVLAEFATLLARKGHQVAFFAAEIAMDKDTIQDIKRKIDQELERSDQLPIQYPQVESLSDLLAILHSSDIVVTSRFHGVLLSLLANRPTLGLSYHQKIDDLIESVESSVYSIAIPTLSVDHAVRCIDSMVENYRELSNRISLIEGQYRQQVDEQYDTISRMICGYL